MNKYDRFLVRGKPIDGGKDYVYGTLNIIEVCPSPIKCGQDDTDCNLYKITYTAPNTVADWNLPYPQKSTFVKPETVGRYTGKDDAFGIKIFEGDIVSFDDINNDRVFGIVIFNMDTLSWVIADAYRIYYNLCSASDMGVIGNTDDNKILLKNFDWDWSECV